MTVLQAPAAPTHRLPGSEFTSLATPSTSSTETAVWRVVIAPGTEPTPHSVTRGEVFVILRGTAAVRLGGTEHSARTGDVIVVPPDTEFELSNAGPHELEAICCMPVGGQARFGEAEAFTPPWAQ